MSCRQSPSRLKPARGPFCEVTQPVQAKVPDGVRRPEYLRAVPNISGNAALDVLIGLFFLYFLLSLVCSAINEAIAAVFRLRSQYLEQGSAHAARGPGQSRQVLPQSARAGARQAARQDHQVAAQAVVHPVAVFALTLLDTFAPPDGARAQPGSDRAREAGARAARRQSTRRAADPRSSRGMLHDALDEARERHRPLQRRRSSAPSTR